MSVPYGTETGLENSTVCYAANAAAGHGGQGEFLRQMTYALDQLPHAHVLSRGARSARAECIDLPLNGWRRTCFNAFGRMPVLRSRHDLLVLMADLDFDSKVRRRVSGASLFEGVMGQCCLTFEYLSRKGTPLVLTALNAHIDWLADALLEEHRRLGIDVPIFVHPKMRERAKREMELASCIRVVSEAARLTFVERGVPEEKIEVVIPAVDLEYFHPVPKKDEAFRVLAVLTIDPRKGAYYLLKAFERAAIPDSELVIIGATGDSWSRRMLQEFMGRLPNIRIQRADVLKTPIEETYGTASVFVHPAVEDGFALAVAQALACGLPVITTRQTGASQLITDGQNGFVLECRDVDGMTDYLKLLARNHSLLVRMREAAANSVAHLGYPSFAQNVERLYRRVLSH